MITRKLFAAATLAVTLTIAPFAPAFAAATTARAHALQDGTPSDPEQTLFMRGQNHYEQGRYEQAATVFGDFLQRYPNSVINDLILLWLGRSYMKLGRLTEAEQVGQRLRQIPESAFTEVYEVELQTARQEIAAARARTTATPATIAAAATPTPRPPQAREVAPLPSPTPRATGIARATPTPTPTSRQTPVAANNNRNNAGRDRRLPARRGTTTQPQIPPPVSTQQQQVARARDRQPTRPAGITPSRTNNTGARPEQQIASTGTLRETSSVERAPVAASSPERPAAVTSDPAYTPPAPVEPAPAQGNAGLTLTVRQVPNLALAMRRNAISATPGQLVQIPMTVTNMGNKADQFRLETDLPAEYQPSFSLAQSGTDTGMPILVTPQLATNSNLEVMLNVRIPATAADGQQHRFYVRAASQADYQITQLADATINVIAAALAGSSAVGQEMVMPGETFTQTITVRNQGSSPARGARADFVFSPEFELVSATPSPFAYDRPTRTAIWNLGELDARGAREITVTLRAVPDAMAAQRSLGRGMMRTESLPVPANFDGPSINVGRVTRVRVDSVSAGLTVTPGDTIYVPFVVRNPGNHPESYELRVTAPGAPPATIYADLNGDGQRQESEPTVGQTAAIDPRGGQYPLLLRVDIPRSTADRQQFAYNVVARSLASGRVANEASTVLTVAVPRVHVRTEQVSEVAAPGDLIYYRLVLVNNGSGLARNLVVTEQLPSALQFVNSEPSLNPVDAPGGAQQFLWRVADLAPGDTAVLRIAVRLRLGGAAEQTLTTRTTLTYQDTNGNNYRGQ